VHFQLHAASTSLTLDFDFDLLLPCNKVDRVVMLVSSTLLHVVVSTDAVTAREQSIRGSHVTLTKTVQDDQKHAEKSAFKRVSISS